MKLLTELTSFLGGVCSFVWLKLSRRKLYAVSYCFRGVRFGAVAAHKSEKAAKEWCRVHDYRYEGKCVLRMRDSITARWIARRMNLSKISK